MVAVAQWHEGPQCHRPVPLVILNTGHLNVFYPDKRVGGKKSKPAEALSLIGKQVRLGWGGVGGGWDPAQDMAACYCGLVPTEEMQAELAL